MGIPATADIHVPTGQGTHITDSTTSALFGLSNTAPLNMFPEPMLQELSKHNPQLLKMIQENHAEFLHLLNEPAEGGDREQFDLGLEEMPHSINVTRLKSKRLLLEYVYYYFPFFTFHQHLWYETNIAPVLNMFLYSFFF